MATPDHSAARPAHAPHDAHAGGHSGDTGVTHGTHHELPTWKTYRWVAIWLFVITIAEVWAYYIPSFVASKAFVPSLLIMSLAKFLIVIMFYMHLKYDHKLFRALFTGPLLIATATIMILLALFGKFR